MADEGKYDAAFMSVLQDLGQIQPFLEAVFSFLGRRTDFYLALADNGKFGFAPGVAENLVKQVSSCWANVPALQRSFASL